MPDHQVSPEFKQRLRVGGFALSALLCAAVSLPVYATDTAVMESGRLLCEVTPLPPVAVANQAGSTVMEQSGKCVDEKNPKVQLNWTAHIQFDDKGVGSLVSGHNHSLIDGKVVGTQTISGGQYIVEFKDGKPVSWSAYGSSYWTSGPLTGRTQSWKSGPTGPTTSWITHKTH